MKNFAFAAALFMAFIAAVFAGKRVEYLSLPSRKSGNFKFYIAGETIKQAICMSRFRGGRDFEKNQMGLTISGPFKKSVRFTSADGNISFTPLRDSLSVPKKLKGRRQFRKLYQHRGTSSRCWLAKFTLPDDMPSGTHYRMRLNRPRWFKIKRRYNASKYFTILNPNDQAEQ